jgi:hypothetical protein
LALRDEPDLNSQDSLKTIRNPQELTIQAPSGGDAEVSRARLLAIPEKVSARGRAQ